MQKDFFRSEVYLLRGQKFIKIEIPEQSSWSAQVDGEAFLLLEQDWTVNGVRYSKGSVVSFDFNKYINTSTGVRLFLEPLKNGSIESIVSTNDFLYIKTLEDVQSRIYQYQKNGEEWEKKSLDVPAYSSADISVATEDLGEILITVEGFLDPSTIYRVNEKTLKFDLFQALSSTFDSGDYKVEQYFAKSKDGTRVPYFMVAPKDLKLNGKNPTLQSGYGGFGMSEVPYFSASLEHSWLRSGGVYVLANIRGGGEYGPHWHQAALKQNRHKAYEDFIAISEDLISRGVTSPRHLAVEGGSNGGLLTGVMTTQRPDLYEAAIIGVPLLDMLRFHKLLAGSSWMAEYGNPENTADREYLASYSPYQNLLREKKYPEVFLYTSTADDRVHPGHARKFAKRMEEFGHPFLYFENMEGGHGGSANNEQAARLYTLEKIYLLQKLFNL